MKPSELSFGRCGKLYKGSDDETLRGTGTGPGTKRRATLLIGHPAGHYMIVQPGQTLSVSQALRSRSGLRTSSIVKGAPRNQPKSMAAYREQQTGFSHSVQRLYGLRSSGGHAKPSAERKQRSEIHQLSRYGVSVCVTNGSLLLKGRSSEFNLGRNHARPKRDRGSQSKPQENSDRGKRS